jgi:hypothetical protein
MNMDYCFSEAMKYNMDGIQRSIWLYDIMCQFWKNLKKRFEGNPYLHFPDTVEIVRGIGLFHVHGHKDECYPRFAPTFIPGAGMVDGEVLETLWSVLNGIADSIRSQSTAHHQETLDDHMNDSNWKKLIHISECKADLCTNSNLMSSIQSSGFVKNLKRLLIQSSIARRTSPI